MCILAVSSNFIWKQQHALGTVDTTQDCKIILGMIMLKDNNSFDIDSFLKDFKNNYGSNISEHEGDNASFVFKVDGEMAAIAFMDVSILQGTLKKPHNMLTIGRLLLRI